MPFPEKSGLIPCILEVTGKSGLGGIEHAGGVLGESIFMAVFSCEHACTAWAAEGVGHETVCEAESVLGNTVQVGGHSVAFVIAAHGLCRVVVGHDIDNVERLLSLRLGGLFVGCLSLGSSGNNSCQGEEKAPEIIFHECRMLGVDDANIRIFG